MPFTAQPQALILKGGGGAKGVVVRPRGGPKKCRQPRLPQAGWCGSQGSNSGSGLHSGPGLEGLARTGNIHNQEPSASASPATCLRLQLVMFLRVWCSAVLDTGTPAVVRLPLDRSQWCGPGQPASSASQLHTSDLWSSSSLWRTWIPSPSIRDFRSIRRLPPRPCKLALPGDPRPWAAAEASGSDSWVGWAPSLKGQDAASSRQEDSQGELQAQAGPATFPLGDTSPLLCRHLFCPWG